MVKIAIAGGSGEVAREIIDVLVASGKHEIFVFTRKEVSSLQPQAGVSFVQADYSSKDSLKAALDGIETVLSFVTPSTDPGNMAQKNLIDASIDAGVKRFAPSEWATSSAAYMSWYAGKEEIRKHLQNVNEKGKVLEYCLFQPGLFTNYFTHPYKSAKHVSTFETQFDFNNCRAIIPDGCDDVKMTLTTASDFTNIVVRAIEYEGEWPVQGGIKGCEISLAEIIRLGEEVRGSAFAVERLKVEDLKAGEVKSTWRPRLDHPALSPDHIDALSGMLLAGFSLGISVGALNVSDEWNRIFPDYEFVQPREFLSEAWRGKS